MAATLGDDVGAGASSPAAGLKSETSHQTSPTTIARTTTSSTRATSRRRRYTALDCGRSRSLFRGSPGMPPA
ncbi:hypothetical protein ACFFX0_17760 [Citricoccus parietis]|uniref:Uncharacterized protein n=1 Tax=Citricoccus parietis TaxID=592307 RepID=A0ABV5G1Y2_9MICC